MTELPKVEKGIVQDGQIVLVVGVNYVVGLTQDNLLSVDHGAQGICDDTIIEHVIVQVSKNR